MTQPAMNQGREKAKTEARIKHALKIVDKAKKEREQKRLERYLLARYAVSVSLAYLALGGTVVGLLMGNWGWMAFSAILMIGHTGQVKEWLKIQERELSRGD